MFAFRCVTSGYEIVLSHIQLLRDMKQQILHQTQELNLM